jgi:hypothetical protein
LCSLAPFACFLPCFFATANLSLFSIVVQSQHNLYSLLQFRIQKKWKAIFLHL